MTTGRSLRSAFSVALLASAVLGMGWLDWRLVSLPVDIRPAAAPVTNGKGPPLPAATLPSSAALPDFSGFLVIAERPLFSPSRRAGESKPVASGSREVPQSLPQWQLSGIMLRNDAARALLKPDADQPASWVRQDDEVSGWRVVRIDAGGVLLRSGEAEQLVELYPDPVPEAAETQ